jgi:predicted GNAT family acetyltransferase
MNHFRSLIKMRSMWANYFEEKGLLVVETQRGFMSAYTMGTVCMVDNFYVKPEYRGTGSALHLTLQLIELAREKGCNTFCAEIYKSDKLYSYILRLHKHFGMHIVEDDQFKTITSKEI